jgi:hypothetical protein
MNQTNDFLRVDLPENLYSAVVSRIGSAKRKSAKRRLVFIGSAILLLLGAFAEAFADTVNSLSRSGFYKYFSLIFSDGFVLLSYWKEFAFSLVESFSLPEFIVLLSLTLVILISIRAMMRNVKIVYSTVQFA